MELTAYTFGDVMVVTRIISQIAMIFDGNAFAVAAKTAALIGIVVALMGGLLRGGQLPPSAFIWPILMAVMLITPKVDLVLEDRSGGLARVDDLPVGFAAPISIITNLGQGVSEMMTANLGLDDTAITMDNGHLLSLRAPIVYSQIITDKEFQGAAAQFSDGLSPTQDTIRYVMTCLNWAAKSASATEKLHALQNQPISALRVERAPMTVGGANDRVYECGDLYDALMDGFESDEYQTALNDSVNKFFGKYRDDTTTGPRYQAALESVVSDKSDFYKAVAFSNALRFAPAYVAESAGGGSQMAALQDALNQKREKNYGTASVMMETIGYSIGFIEAWSFSIMPLMLLLFMAGAAGTKTGVRYMWMLVWIQLWYPSLLITMGYSDAGALASSITNTTSVAALNAFMTEILRLQDTTYLNLAGATGLSMFLVLGASSAIQTAMQRDITGSEHYDPKKNAPDTLQRSAENVFKPHYSFGPASGSVGMGTDAKQMFNGATFTYDYTRADGVTWEDQRAFAAGEVSSVTTSAGHSSTSSTGRSSNELFSAARRSSTGKDSSSSLSFGTDATSGARIGDRSSSQDGYSHVNTLSGGAQGQVSASAGLPGAAEKGAPIKGSAQVGIGLTGQTQFSHSSGDIISKDLGYDLGVTEGSRASSSATARQSNEASETDTKSSSTTSGYVTADDYREQGAQVRQTSGSTSESERHTTTRTADQRVGVQVDAISAATQMAMKPEIMRRLNEAVTGTGLTHDVERFMDSYSTELDKTFGGRGSDDAKYAFAATYVMQGLAGPLFIGQERANERREAVNAMSDEILGSIGFPNGRPGEAGASTPNLGSVAAVSPSEVAAGMSSAFRGYKLTEEAVQGALDRTPSVGDMDQRFAAFQRELGVDLDKLQPGQVNGILATMRNRMDAELGPINENEEGFAKRYRDVGLVSAFQSMVWKDNADVRREAIDDAYRSDRREALIDTRTTDPSAPEAAAAVGEAMIAQRVGVLYGAGVAAEDDELARFMALQQLEVGAAGRKDEVLAGYFHEQSAAIVAADPALASGNTASRIAAFAMNGASSEAMTDGFRRAQQEYMIGSMEAQVESRTGKDVNSEGISVSWGNLPASAGGAGRVSPQELFDYMTNEKGMEEHVARGIIANIQSESAFEIGVIEKQNGVGIGLFQHSYDRRDKLEAYLEQRGTTIDDWKAQLDFAFDVELKGSHRSVAERLDRTTNASEAAIVFMDGFERPNKDLANIRREQYSLL